MSLQSWICLPTPQHLPPLLPHCQPLSGSKMQGRKFGVSGRGAPVELVRMDMQKDVNPLACWHEIVERPSQNESSIRNWRIVTTVTFATNNGRCDKVTTVVEHIARMAIWGSQGKPWLLLVVIDIFCLVICAPFPQLACDWITAGNLGLSSAGNDSWCAVFGTKEMTLGKLRACPCLRFDSCCIKNGVFLVWRCPICMWQSIVCCLTQTKRFSSPNMTWNPSQFRKPAYSIVLSGPNRCQFTTSIWYFQ